MKARGISTSTFSILAGGVFVLATGLYTDNGGIQLGGGILLFVGFVQALRDLTGKTPDSSA